MAVCSAGQVELCPTAISDCYPPGMELATGAGRPEEGRRCQVAHQLAASHSAGTLLFRSQTTAAYACQLSFAFRSMLHVAPQFRAFPRRLRASCHCWVRCSVPTAQVQLPAGPTARLDAMVTAHPRLQLHALWPPPRRVRGSAAAKRGGMHMRISACVRTY